MSNEVWSLPSSASKGPKVTSNLLAFWSDLFRRKLYPKGWCPTVRTSVTCVTNLNTQLLFYLSFSCAAEYGVIIVNPDTSPRGLDLPGDSDSYDFGVGAGFYLNATQKPWSGHYRMFSYVTSELRNLITTNFPVLDNKQSIMGHRYIYF